MIIGHLPVAYLGARATIPKTYPSSITGAFLIGGVFPDLDMIWFYTFGERAHHHHDYVTHRPAIYLGLLCALTIIGVLSGRWFRFGIALAFGALLHLALDSVADETPGFGRSAM